MTSPQGKLLNESKTVIELFYLILSIAEDSVSLGYKLKCSVRARLSLNACTDSTPSKENLSTAWRKILMTQYMHIIHIIKSWTFSNHQYKEAESQILICLPGAELKVCLLSNSNTMEPHFELKEQRGRPGCLQVFGWPFCMVNIAQSLLGCLLGERIHWLRVVGDCAVLRHENKLRKKPKPTHGTGGHIVHFLSFTHTKRKNKLFIWQTCR